MGVSDLGPACGWVRWGSYRGLYPDRERHTQMEQYLFWDTGIIVRDIFYVLANKLLHYSLHDIQTQNNKLMML